MSETKISQTTTKKMSYKSLLIENIKYRTLLTEKYKNKKPYVPKNEKVFQAFIPGTVTEIFIKPKKRVKEGDSLLVLEAMKMRNVIMSPVSGTIKSVYVSTGERVKKNDILLEFE
ncbi:MAG: acetyl-CoA carboxylase biotin carboxyl carrier protein subunit [Bacteroidales bacterium]|nr:acetyl-CoA carboxylase biotin carboxyl carrier protein subunit [Bacteroidales bacterium]